VRINTPTEKSANIFGHSWSSYFVSFRIWHEHKEQFFLILCVQD
jgi:hypothetical protein